MLPDYHYLSLNALMQYKSSIFENYIPVYTDDDEHNLNVFEDILKKHFGYAGFKNIFQALATFYLSTGCKSLFLIGPTAIGKSAPIICNAIAEYDMATVLILPTIDLMIQFSNICRKAGLAYFSFNSKSSKQDKANLVKLASEDQSAFLKICRLLIVTPESFRTEDFKDILSSLARKKCLARIVVDECHLVYDQGYDFRKAFTKMLSDIQRAYTTQIVFTSASLSPQTIALFSDDCELIDNIVIRCASVKQNHMYFKFRKEDMICFNEYEDGFTRLKTLKESYFKDRSVKVIIVLRKIYELTKARNQYTSDLFELFEFHGDLDHEEKKRNKEMWERSSNAILLTVPSNLTGIDFQGCNVMIHHRVCLSVSDLYQELGRLGRDESLGLSFLYFSSNNIFSHKTLSTSRRDKISKEETRATSQDQVEQSVSRCSSTLSNASFYFLDENNTSLELIKKNKTERCINSVFAEHFDSVEFDTCLFNCSVCYERNKNYSLPEIKNILENLNSKRIFEGILKEEEIFKRKNIMTNLYECWKKTKQNLVNEGLK